MGVVESWGQSSPDEAEKWIAALPEGETKKSLQEEFQKNKSTCGMPVTRVRVRAIPTAPDLQKILDAPLNQARQDALAKYLVEWFEKDREKATPWITAKLKGYVLALNAGMVAREWSKKIFQPPPSGFGKFRPFSEISWQEWELSGRPISLRRWLRLSLSGRMIPEETLSCAAFAKLGRKKTLCGIEVGAGDSSRKCPHRGTKRSGDRVEQDGCGGMSCLGGQNHE